MQSIAGLPPAGDTVEPVASVTIAGKTYGLDVLGSVKVERELSSALPAQVSAASGITAASGSASWLPAEDSTTAARSPWDVGSIKPGDPVTVDMGFGSALARQLTGVVDSDAGSLSGGSAAEFVDLIDKLNKRVSFPPHLSFMPPTVDGGAYLAVNNIPTFTTDRILRACGFYATPSQGTKCILSLPLMGSAWPEVGTIVSASQAGAGNGANPPSFVDSSWGVAVDSMVGTYTPDGSSVAGDLRMVRTLSISFKLSGNGTLTTSSYVRCSWGAGGYIALLVTPARSVVAHFNDGTTTTTVATILGAAGASASVFTMNVNSAGGYAIYASNGVTATGSVTLTNAMKTTNMANVSIATPHQTGVSFGGVLVNFAAGTAYLEPETARLTSAAWRYGLPAMRRIDDEVALDVLKAQAEAECASMWIDENGVFRWVNRNVATGAAPVATLTALDDLFDISWESNASGVRNRAVVRSDEATINKSDYANKTLWQGSGDPLESGQTSVEFAEPDADVEWLGVDEGMAEVLTTAGWPSDFNRGIGSWDGGIETSDTGERWATVLSSTLANVGMFGYKVTQTAGNPGTGWTVEPRTGTTSAALRSSKKNFNLPVLRGRAVVEWGDRWTSGAALGPLSAGDLSHDVGPWVQDPAALQELADWLSAQVVAPRPVLRDLDVVPDVRRQLGDVVWVEDNEITRRRWKVMLTKISTSVEAGSMKQTVGGNVLSVEALGGATNADLDARAGTFTNAGFDTLWADATNAQLDSGPLGRG